MNPNKDRPVLDLHRLRLLRELHGRGTVHAAAAALGYSPSTVSQQLSVLEREAGTALLERTGRRVRLTPAGHALLRHAVRLLEGVEEAEAELAALAAGRTAGLVRVASFQSAFLSIVAPAIAALAESHPDVRVEAVEAEAEQAIPALQLHAYDVVVGEEYAGQPRPVADGLRRERLLRERINVLLPRTPDRAPALADLSARRWSACQPGTGQHAMHLRVCRELGGFEPDTRYLSDDFAICVAMVRDAGAATLLPDLVLGHGAGTGDLRVVPIDDARVGREVFSLTRAGRTPAVEAVAAALHAAADALPAPAPRRDPPA